MIRPPPRSTRTDTLFPYTTLFRSLVECFLEGGNAAPFGIDSRQQGTGWLAATIGRHAVPVKGVVPNLRRIVKYTTRRLLHDVFQGSRFEFRACNQVVQVGNVSLMMLAVVELERFLGNGRRQGVECVRKRGKRQSNFY